MMDVLQAIQSRRSIRRFKADSLPRESIEAILDAGRLAPSGKNNQPWRFVVVQNDEREKMYSCLQAGLAKAEKNGLMTGSAEYTFKIMREAPAIVFIFDTKDGALQKEQTVTERVFGIVEHPVRRGRYPNHAAARAGNGNRFPVDLRYVLCLRGALHVAWARRPAGSGDGAGIPGRGAGGQAAACA